MLIHVTCHLSLGRCDIHPRFQYSGLCHFCGEQAHIACLYGGVKGGVIREVDFGRHQGRAVVQDLIVTNTVAQEITA